MHREVRVSRFKNTLYQSQRIVNRNHRLMRIKNEDGTLFSGCYKTKILAEDLPEWYIEGQFYKCHGYLSVKGITDLIYLLNMFMNHFLADDFLLIAYGGEITENSDDEKMNKLDKFQGYDRMVWGGEIRRVMKGVRQYSNYDISNLIEQIKAKQWWKRILHSK